MLAVNRTARSFRGINGHLPAKTRVPSIYSTVPEAAQLTAARAVRVGTRAIPPSSTIWNLTMNAVLNLSIPSRASAFEDSLSLEQVRHRAPAVFASAAHARTSPKYTFIPTERVLAGLMGAGFVPVEARQAHTRIASMHHARHVLRLRRRYETVQLRDAVPEIVFLNSHDGTSAYQLRMGLFRVVCTNGLIVSRGAFPGVCVAHRGDIVVITGALRIAEQFEILAGQVERMEAWHLLRDEQLGFAHAAMAVRYPDMGEASMQPAQLLRCRRVEDQPDNLWSTLNRVQENLLRGGLTRWAANGRLSHTRRITSLREDVRINGRLWDLAAQVLVA